MKDDEYALRDYKSVPEWVQRNLIRNRNCYVSKRTYILIKEDLKEWFGKTQFETKEVVLEDKHGVVITY